MEFIRQYLIAWHRRRARQLNWWADVYRRWENVTPPKTRAAQLQRERGLAKSLRYRRKALEHETRMYRLMLRIGHG